MRVRTPKSWVTQFEVIDRNLVVRFSPPRRVISSAVRGGGIGWAHAIINHQVSETFKHSKKEKPQTPQREDPTRTLGKIADRLGISGRCVGLMTMVDLGNLVVTREQVAGLWVEGLFTIGVTNAVRAGEPASDLFPLGTINIILVTNAKLAMAALVGAVTVATESKTAKLLEERISSSSGSGLATGTGTDSIVIAIGDGPRLRYSGTHTKMGELIGRVVARGMGQGLEMIKSSRKKSAPPLN
jgi:adenosylcobinamide amidohydrolase